jgi:hypothetical protein
LAANGADAGAGKISAVADPDVAVGAGIGPKQRMRIALV